MKADGKRPALTLLVVLCCLSLPAPLSAQEASPPVRVGDRVRISAEPLAESAVTARVVAASDATLTLEVPPFKAPVEVPFSSIKDIEVSRGKRSKAAKGAAIGGLGSAAFFTALYLIICTAESGDCGDAEAFKFIGYAAAAGTLTGAAIGAAFHGERWERIELQKRRLAAAPGPRGLSVALRF